MAKYFYSPETKGFYLDTVHRLMPEDVFEIKQEQYDLLIEGQTLGKEIVYKSRKLKLVDREDPGFTWESIRRRRDGLLTKCDWTQIPDAQLTLEVKEQWRAYRQSLRDLTEVYDDPNDVIWPLSPDAPNSTEE